MRTYTQIISELYLDEASSRVSKSVSDMKSYVKSIVEKAGYKVTSSSRGGYHIRFNMDGDMKKYVSFFKNYNIVVKETSESISSKFETYKLVLQRTTNGIKRGTELYWVNNNISTAKKGKQYFNNKDLSPDRLNVAGRSYNTAQLINDVSRAVQDRYPDDVSAILIDLLHKANTRKDKISITDVNNIFSSKDLSKVSADYGEILSAIWSMKAIKFSEVDFPKASNEKLIDFYGVAKDTKRPVSVKSGSGGKVTIQNIIDAIEKIADERKVSSEKAVAVFRIAKDNTMKEGMIKLHQYMNTEAIQTLSRIINVPVANLSVPVLLEWFNDKTDDEANELLEPFWKELNTNLSKKVLYSSDKIRRIISPLGESIWKILNNDRDIKKSLNNLAKQVILVQVNVDVKKKVMMFKKSKFSESTFKFAWAGYAAGNKLGFLKEK